VLALIPVLGGLVWFAAVVFGLGALLVAIWRARTTGRPGPDSRLTPFRRQPEFHDPLDHEATVWALCCGQAVSRRPMPRASSHTDQPI
jgi:hypothetical protein